MTRRPVRRALHGAAALLAVPALALLTGSGAAAPAADASTPSPAVQACEEAAETGWSARVRRGAKTPEPPTYAKKYARKFHHLRDSRYLGHGRVRVRTVFHVITAEPPTRQQHRQLRRQVRQQTRVLNASYSGRTARDVDAADTGGARTPFRFARARTTWTVNEDWAVLSSEEEELAMKRALYQGDARTLNVYVTKLEGGLLGFAYFPGAFDGPDYLDGVVMLDGTLPGGYAGPYGEGDTLVHETGHWLALEHTFEGGCSEENDGVADTPAEAEPQFGCPVGADTCVTPGLDPVHNFMDYVDDVCMYEFTPGQADRMSDAWVQFRADGTL